MAEVAGLVIGAIPIAIWAFEKYQEPFIAYTKYDNAINTLKNSLQIQKTILDDTLGRMGLEDPTPEELSDCFVRKFPDGDEQLLFIIRQMDSLATELMEGLMVDVNGKPRWKDNSTERVSWEWTKLNRAFRTKQSNKIISDLRILNEDLKNLIERAEVPTEDGLYVANKTKLRFNHRSCNSLRIKLRGLHAAIKVGFVGVCSEYSHKASIELDDAWLGEKPSNRRRMNDGIPVFTIHLVHESEYESVPPWRSFQALHASTNTADMPSIKSSLLASHLSAPSPPLSPSQSHSPSRSVRSWLRKTVSIVSQKDIVKDEKQPLTRIEISKGLPRITDLCAEIHSPKLQKGSASFGLLKGSDNEGFSLQHLPDSHPKITQTIGLREMLTPSFGTNGVHSQSQSQSQSQIQDMGLSAKRRYALAANLARAVLYLSDSPWLSDPWDHDEVKLFIQEQDSPYFCQTLSKHAHISCRFDASSQPSSSAARPDALRPVMRIIPNRAIFALGILLIELAINQTIPQSSLDAILQGDFLMLGQYAKRAELEAGSSYGFAALRCVNCEFSRSPQMDFSLPQFQEQFHDNVIAPLQGTSDVFSQLRMAA